MDMREDIFAQETYGKIALQKIKSNDQNFRLYEAGWLGDGRTREVMEVTGAVFREALSGKNKGQLTIIVPNTTQKVFVTAREMNEFEANNQVTQKQST